MIDPRRAAIAALFLSAAIAGAPAPASAASAPSGSGDPNMAGARTLPNGLETIVRRATASGAVAIEVWVRCPSDGWSASQPGIARLTAFAVVSARTNGQSLRDIARSAGGQVSVSVFQSATEIAVLAPTNEAPNLQDALTRRIFSPAIDAAALNEAKARLAAQQAASHQSSDVLLRDGVFAALFSAGPMHDSTFGDDQSLRSISLSDVQDFAARSYVARNAIVIAIGNADEDGLVKRLASTSALDVAPPAMPASSRMTGAALPLELKPWQAREPGVALAWTGPPIADQRAATAMDFLSDYLADTHEGLMAHAATAAHAGASFDGQFVTLRDPGVFFVSAYGDGVDTAPMVQSLESAFRDFLARPIPQLEFSAALSAYESRLLRQMDSPQGLADNFGWYFAQNAVEYAPSDTDADLHGAYFANAASLTPGYVHDVAQKYLGVAPAVVILSPIHVTPNVSTGGM